MVGSNSLALQLHIILTHTLYNIPQKMGLTSSYPPSPQSSSLNLYASPNFYSLSPPSPQVLLSQFRLKLTDPQCGYVFTVLLHQYFLMISSKVAVMVSDNQCRVTDQGQVIVFSWSEGDEEEKTCNCMKAFSKIITLVDGLSKSSQLWNGELGYLKQVIISLLFQKNQNQQRFHSILLQEVKKYTERGLTESSLRSAMRRVFQENRTELKKHKRYQSTNLHPSFGNLNIDSNYSIGRIREQSNSNIQSRLSKCQKISHFHPTIFHQDDLSDITHIEYSTPDIRCSYSSISKKPIRTPQHYKRQLSRNFTITAIYSLAIGSCCPAPLYSQQINVPSEARMCCIRKKKRYVTQDMRFSCPEKGRMKLHRNSTSINLQSSANSNQRRNEEAGRSVLATMARLVVVRQEPSSKSIIY